MGNKIITEKDFWKCDTGAVPAQFQSTQKTVKKISGEKYITTRDTATSSWIDFGCTRLMLIYAIIAAAVVVIAAMTVATGGAALIALGALAGLAGAAWGAIVGTLLCGQIAAKARKWVGSKKDYIVQGVETITGDHIMTCPVGGTIKFAPEIKNWSQAVALGFANYTGKLMEGMMAGAAIGMAGAAVAGGAGAFASGGIRGVGQAAWQFAKSMPKNFLVNAYESIKVFGLGLRGVMGAQNVAATYGNTGEASGWDFLKGTVAMETGAWDSANVIYSDMTGGVILDENGIQKHAGWQDYVGMALMFSPIGQGKRDLENKLKNEPKEPVKETEGRADDADGNRGDEEGNGRPEVPNEGNSTIGGQADAYEARIGERRISDELYDELRDETPTQEIRDMVNEGIQLPMPDPVLPGLEITKRLHADHIVPMDRITRMEGFDTLTREQQLAVLNNPENFVGLSASANTSKGPKTFAEWTQHKSRGIDVDPDFRREMMEREQQLERRLQQQIDELNRLNNGG